MSVKLDPSPILRALIFDLVGTCTNWRSPIVAALQSQCSSVPVLLPSLQSEEDLVRFASDWRMGFFREIHQRFERRDPQEDIDLTHRRVLDQLLSRKETLVTMDVWGDEIRSDLVQSWHHQDGIFMVPSYDVRFCILTWLWKCHSLAGCHRGSGETQTAIFRVIWSPWCGGCFCLLTLSQCRVG